MRLQRKGREHSERAAALKERASEKPPLPAPGPRTSGSGTERNTCLLFILLVGGFVMAALADGPGSVVRVHLIADKRATVGSEKEVEARSSCGEAQSGGSGHRKRPTDAGGRY